ncbi:MAG: MOSC domain-containing protein [Chloroflexota bacterium]|nr:MOSC domain-containing protein [Chloroflexota bacterium]MDE2859113.1 MOSC domain-containing protein [Chloroflexota bacterium]MDE2952672.1 MOSC domain-containing protein [Chloroflexota bacterium]
MEAVKSFETLNEAWDQLEKSPGDGGRVEMIARRPEAEQREEVQSARFTAARGLEGDDWLSRAKRKAPDSEPIPETQVTLMNSRVIQLLTDEKSRWAESGDQLFVDLDISMDNLPAGTQLQIGEVILEIGVTPHTGCGKFARRFGAPARKWVMSDAGKHQRLRGVYARVIQDGLITVGDKISKR